MKTLKNFCFSRLGYLTLNVAVLMFYSGCNNNKPGYFDVSGTVQLNGKDVPTGRIIFSPDGGKGNSGAQGLVEISQGKITKVIRPIVGGPHWLEIQAFDGAAGKDVEGMVTLGKRLIPIQKAQVDLPRSDVELAIDMQGTADNRFTVTVKILGD